jgi:hypothetical protein
MDLTRAALVLFGLWMASGIGRTLLAIGNLQNGNRASVPLPILNRNYLPYILLSPLLPLSLWFLPGKRIFTMGTLWFVGRWSWAFWVAFAPFSWWMVVLLPFVFFTWATQASRNC